MVTGVPGARATSALADTRFADVCWVAETGSTNADVMALARDAAPEGVVVVADHQTAGRGRSGRTWTAPSGASLLCSILLRPPSEVVDLVTMALAVSAAAAVEDTAGFSPRLKWPNDLVWPGDGSAPDRKLAGILAEADWPVGTTASGGWRPPGPGERLAVVAGIGINCDWPDEVPDELADIAVAANHVTGRPLDREELLIALLRHLDAVYGDLVRSQDRAALLDAWRARSATLGRRVRVEVGTDDWEGSAVDVTEAGHLVVESPGGHRRTFAVGDVVHLRDA
jgi:BirA family transcriptional regulator, biotin operon repressor / biotin---[acetyl-CoA-carboxylase] ligase